MRSVCQPDNIRDVQDKVCCYCLLGGLQASAQAGVEGLGCQPSFESSSCMHDNHV
jgi:hypothetical protein